MAKKTLSKEGKEYLKQVDEEAKVCLVETASMIKAFRETQGMTQRQVAKKAGIFQQQYARIESGRYNFTLKTLYAVAHAMGARIEIRLVPLKDK